MRKGITILLLFSIMRFLVGACGWDWDTIAMEKRQFPSVHELITGKFLRHSQPFYYWRIKDRSEKLISHPDSLALYDDLAWAYDKTGEHELAIETMLRKEALSPGIYETYANLGTSYIHNGEYKKGLKYIKKAIEINPEAHFGREIYQMYLVEYVISKPDSSGIPILPLSSGKEPDFYTFLKDNHFKEALANGSSKEAELSKAVKGIAGMMKFGQYNSPILLEVLGDLLYAANSGADAGAGHLAARAYLRASFETKKSEVQKAYENKANQSIERVYFSRDIPERHRHELQEPAHQVYPLKNLTAVLKIEILSADLWYDEIRQNELNWIEAGVNPDSAFAANYYEEPEQEFIYEQSSNIFKEVDEEAWLKRQLERPESIRSIHNISKLDPEITAALDSIYEAEFRQMYPEDTVTKTKEKPEEDGTKSEFDNTMIYFLLGIVFILMVVFVLLKKKSKRR